MNLILIGTNHRYSDIRTRERLSFSGDDIKLALSAIVEERIADGAVVLSTCQRVEIYVEGGNAESLKKFLLNFKEVRPSYARHLYIREGEEAAMHLFKVASGLDSQVVGEGEILHQIREAYFTARGVKTTTPFLNRLFERAIFTGKLIRRTMTLPGREPSIASSAVECVGRMTSLKGKNVFIIGSGVVAGRVARLVAGKSAKCIIVANRTFERAAGLAGEVNGKAVRFGDFYGLLNEADIIFSATASRHPVLKRDIFKKNRTAKRKLVIFDLAFPRDIDAAIAEIEGVTLFNLDDFREDSLFKNREIEHAYELAAEKAEKFLEKENKRWRSGSVPGQALLR